MHSLVIEIVASIFAVLLGVVLVHLLRQRRERHLVQENLPSFSVLEVDTNKLHEPSDVAPALLRQLDRLARLVGSRRSAIYISER